MKVLVVDDDDIAGGLSKELLTEAGFEVELLTVSTRAMERIKANRYPLVVLDILMPGVDGLTLCHKIKTDPQLKGTKVVMVSGKSFEADKQRARQYGADLFIEKPYNVETFAQLVQEVAGRQDLPPPPPGEAIEPEALSAPEAKVKLTVWGSRSLPGASAPPSSKYGKKTSCVSLEAGGKLLIFDAGTGLADLGAELVKTSPPREIYLFLSHFHPDHVRGLGLFAPFKTQGWTVHVSGAREPDLSLEDLVRRAFEQTVADDKPILADIRLHEMAEESYEIMLGVTLTAFYANHPGTTLGFMANLEDRRVIFCPDTELYGEMATALQDFDEKLSKLCRGADLLILDARYTPEDYRTLKNHGHSSWQAAVDFAGRYGVKRLLLFHADSQYSDEVLARIAAESARRCGERQYPTKAALARDGAKISL